jgi:hypothetical protein
MADATIEVEAKLIDQMSGSLKAIQNEMARLERTTFDSTKGIKNELDSLKRKTEENKNAFGGLSQSIGKWALGVGAGIFSVQKLTQALSFSIQAAREQELADRALEVTLRATGNAIGYTVDELKAMASAIQETTKFSDDSTQRAQAMLLTFDHISKDIFPEVTKTAADLAAALGMDIVSAAQSLGQALQQPESAGRKLRAMNILLTESQQELIESLVETGNEEKAQALILDELTKRYGGYAESTVTSTQLLLNAMGDDAEVVGGVFVSVMERAARAILKVRNAAQAGDLTPYSGVSGLLEQSRSANGTGEPDWMAEAKRLQDQESGRRGPTASQQAFIDANQKKAEEEQKKVREKAKKDAEEAKKEQEDRFKAANDIWEKGNKQLAEGQRKYDEKIKEAREKEIQEAKEASRILAEARAGGDDKKLLEIKQQEELDKYAGNEQAITDIKAAHVLQRMELQKELDAKTLQNTQRTNDAIVSNYLGMGQAISQVLGIFAGKSKAAFLAQQAFAIGEIAVNTARAYVAALAPPPLGLGPVLGIPLANSILGLGAAQGAVVAATTVSKFERGGPVNGPSHAGGGVRAELEGGEFVLSRRDVASLGGVGGVEAMRRGGGSRIDVGGIQITLSGSATRADAEMVGDALERRLLGLVEDLETIDYRGMRRSHA